jgi:hypothetical protein
MKRNVGTADRAIRLLLGIGLISAVFLVEGPTRWFGLVGLIPLLTAMAGNCPLYSLLGLSSCPAARPKM